MRGVIFFLFLLFSTVGVTQTTYPTNQWFGSASTLTEFRGASKAVHGFVNAVYADTATANLAPGYLKFYPGAQIMAGDSMYFRNLAATAWLLMNGSGGGGVYTASEGLNMTGNDIRIGGVVTNNNTISFDNYKKNFSFRTTFHGDSADFNFIATDSIAPPNGFGSTNALSLRAGKIFKIPAFTITGFTGGVSSDVEYQIKDSAKIRSYGGDYGFGHRSEIRSTKMSGYSGRSVYVGGTILSETTPVQLNNFAFPGTSTTSNYRYARGYWSGSTSYIYLPTNDTIESWMGYYSMGFATGKINWAVDYAGGFWGNSSIATKSWFLHNTGANSNSYHRAGFYIGDSALTTSAILNVTSTTRGALMPRMTSTQRTAISSPATGLLVFDLDSSALFQYTGSAWQNLYNSAGNLSVATAGPGEPIWYTSGDSLYLRSINGAITEADGSLTISGGISDGDKGDITVSGSGATWTIDNDVVTFSKFQNITQARLLGRYTASTGDMQEISLGSGLSLDAGTGVLSAPGGATTFVALTDGPGSFSGQAGKSVRVNVGETALEYFTAAGTGDVVKVGTPVNNQLGVWTGDGTIEGDANITFASSTLNIGVAGAATGIFTLSGVTSGTITIQPASASGTYTLTLPTTDGGVNEFLQTDGSGVLTWAAGGGTPALTQYRLAVGDASNLLSTGAAITGGRALISDANGVPTHATTTATEIGYVSGVTSAIQTQIDRKFSMNFLCGVTATFTDAATLYFGNVTFTANSTWSANYITIDRDCTLASINIESLVGTAGTNEAWSLYVRVNDATDHLIESTSVTGTRRRWDNIAINIALVAGDQISIKSINPTWATNPANGYFSGYATFK